MYKRQVPQRWKDDPQLGKWVDNQKTQFRKYEADPATSQLSAERVLALREMGAIASWSLAFLIRSVKSEARTWEESRVLLEAYRDAHDGCCNVSDRWKEDPQLGKWVMNQKYQFRKYEADPATSSLSAERVLALREMGAIDSWSLAFLIRSAERRESEARTWEESRVLLEAYRDVAGSASYLRNCTFW